MFNRLFSQLRSLATKVPDQKYVWRTLYEENLARYCLGGYHPVRVGDVFNNGNYQVLRKLGYGGHSTVWLAHHLKTKQRVALKVLTADCYGTNKDTFELAILQHIRSQGNSEPGSNHILGLLDNFEHRGPNGNHVCLVCEAMGPDLITYRGMFPERRIPIARMKSIAKQLLLALDFLHSTCGIIHTDIKPQNILLETLAIRETFREAPMQAFISHLSPPPPPYDFFRASDQLSSAKEDLAQATDISVRLADFGTSIWNHKHLTEWIQPKMLRAPEVILGAEWNSKVDIWNVGLVIWELAEGALVFDGTWTATSPYSSAAHLAQMESILGPMPASLLARAKYGDQFFDDKGKLLMPPTFRDSFSSFDNIFENPQLSDSERTSFVDFIRSMVRLEPERRLSARQLLKSKWLEEGVGEAPIS